MDRYMKLYLVLCISIIQVYGYDKERVFTKFRADIILTGFAFLSTFSDVVVSVPVQISRNLGYLPPVVICRETADCDVDKQYCDLNIKRCSHCNVLCNEERGLEGECLRQCRAYTLLLNKSTTSTTSANEVEQPMRTTANPSTPKDQNYLQILLVILAIFTVTLVVALLAIVTVLWKLRTNKQLKEIDKSQHASNPNYYSEEPTASNNNKIPRESDKLMPDGSLTPTATDDNKSSDCLDSGIFHDEQCEEGNNMLRNNCDIGSQIADPQDSNRKDYSPCLTGQNGELDGGICSLQSDEQKEQTTEQLTIGCEDKNKYSQQPNSRESSGGGRNSSVTGLQGRPSVHQKGGGGMKINNSYGSSEPVPSGQKGGSNSINKCQNRMEKWPQPISSDNSVIIHYDPKAEMSQDYAQEESTYPSEPIPTPVKPKPYHQNKHIYEQLRKIPWVEGYFSEGQSIQVYVDLMNLDPEWASRQLQAETGQPKDKFHIIHSAQLT